MNYSILIIKDDSFELEDTILDDFSLNDMEGIVIIVE